MTSGQQAKRVQRAKAEAYLREAKPKICPRCGADVLTGDSDDSVCFTATVDPVAIRTPLEEVAALLKRGPGSMSYDLAGRPPHQKLYSRRAGQPFDPKYVVVVDHVHAVG